MSYLGGTGVPAVPDFGSMSCLKPFFTHFDGDEEDEKDFSMLEHFQKLCSDSERGFLVLGKALAREHAGIGL